jgi:hypothetical protein
MQSKTITTYLINGKPKGLRTVFISNKVCKALIVPREDVEKIKEREEAGRPSLYFLISQDDENNIYIGESESFYDRLRNHQTGKDFWDIAVSFFSQNNDLTKADVKYLEHLSLKTLNSEQSQNKKESTKPHLPEHQQASIEEFFEDVKLITGFLGYTFFTPKTIIKDEKDSNEILYCTRSGTNARGIFKDNIFTLLKGSKIVKELKAAYTRRNDDPFFDRTQERRNNLMGDNFKIIDNDFIELLVDIKFGTPSGASCFVVGNASNGWTNWKNKDGKTLDEILRKD